MAGKTPNIDNSNPTGFRFLDRTLNIIGAIAAVAATVWGIVVKIQVDQQNIHVEQLKAAISQAASDREERKLDLDMTLLVFNEVKDIYKTEDQSDITVVNRLSATSALVLAVPDQEIRERLGQAITAALDMVSNREDSNAIPQAKKVKENFEAAIFDAASAQEGVPSQAISNTEIKSLAEGSTKLQPKWGALNYNLFWCEDSDNPTAALEAATQAQSLRSLDDKAKGEWRVRKLPKSVNERSGYQIHRNLIRTSSKEETAIGDILVQVLADHGAPGFEVQEINYPSPASISVFFCGHQ